MQLKLSEFLPFQLSITSNKVSGLIAKAYERKFGITIPCWRVLLILNEQTNLSQLEICKLTIMDKVTVSRAVSTLLNRGLIKKIINNSDKRHNSLSLSEDGQSILDEVIPFAKSIEKSLIELVGAQEIELLANILKKIEAKADNLLVDK